MVRLKNKALDKIETAGKKKLNELWGSALRRTITWVRKIGFYKRRFAKVRTGKAVKDMSILPMLSKKDLLRSMGKGRFPAPCWTRVSNLSFIGLTGGPGAEAMDDPLLPVPLRAIDMVRRGDLASRALRTTGDQKGRTIMLEEISHSVVHQSLLRGLIRVGGTPVQLGRGFTLRHVRHTIPKLRPGQMVTYPTFALFLKDLLDREGKELRLRKIFLWGEIGGSIPAVRKKVARAFKAKVFDIYAMQELGVLGAECPEHNGLHGFEDKFYYEIIDPRTKEVLGDGKRGELVVTELSRNAMPLIRYRTGDITSIVRGRCKCGRTHLRLDGISGRVDQTLTSSDQELVTASDIAEKVWSNPHLTGSFRMDPGKGVVVETKEHREMSRYYLEKAGFPSVKVTFERILPKFLHRTEFSDNERYHTLLKEQMRLEV